jgi:hypothetical protein
MPWSSGPSRENDLTEPPAVDISYKETNIREIDALIIGPPDTPYALGFYQVSHARNEMNVQGFWLTGYWISSS